MVIFTEKIKKVFTTILIVIVSVLVVFALYMNKDRFCSIDPVKYAQVTIDENTNLDNIIASYDENTDTDVVVDEIKKINNLTSLSNETVYGKTIYIPIFEN
jgi:hypothetical protein